jgi:LmbE family N-acetylglucosaminyl deacetylase
MIFRHAKAEIFVPDGTDVEMAIGRTTHLGIGAHHDDLEIMAIDGILQCFSKFDNWFTGVVVTDGGGAPRAGLYEHYTDEEMMEVRVAEQKKAAVVGGYGAQVFLGYPSSAVKTPSKEEVIDDIIDLMRIAKPKTIYTHNLADKHATHVGVAVKVVQALRRLSKDELPECLYGCEVWRDLGWMLDEEKVVFDVSTQTNLQDALLGIFDSQISGGKRYDRATMGRRLANATYYSSHSTDITTGLVFAMDLMPLVEDATLDICEYVLGYIERFSQDVKNAIQSVT